MRSSGRRGYRFLSSHRSPRLRPGHAPHQARLSVLSTSAALARMARSSRVEFRLMVRFDLFSLDNWWLSLVRFVFLRAAPAALRRSEV
jgi:hypothetical protein